MKINAVAVSSRDLPKTIRFYSILGLKFPEVAPEDTHVESLHSESETKLMIDTHQFLTELLRQEPVTANHSNFAIEYSSPEEANSVCNNMKEAGFVVASEPWDAFWGQRYATVKDPDGYFIDLYATLEK